MLYSPPPSACASCSPLLLPPPRRERPARLPATPRAPGRRSSPWSTPAAVCPPTSSRRRHHRRADVHDQHRRLPLERGAAERLGSSAPPSSSAGCRRPSRTLERHGAPRARAASSTTGTTTATGQAHDLAAHGRAARPDPVARSTTAGWPPACASSATACRSSPRRARRSTTRWISASTTVPDAEPDPVPLPRRHRQRRPCCYDTVSPRAGSPATSASPRASCRARSTTGVAHLPRHLRLLLAGDPSRPASTAHLRRRRPLRRLLPLRGSSHARAGAASMFEALMPCPVRARGALGAAPLGRQPPAHRATRRSTTAWSSRSTATGASRPSNTPEGGYAAYGVDAIGMNPERHTRRTRTTRSSTTASPAARAGRAPDPPPVARTPTAWSPRTRRSSALRYAPRAAIADLAQAAQAISDIYGQWGFRDSVNVDTGARSRPPTCPSTRG